MKSKIIFILLGIGLGISISVGAVYLYSAKDIEYTNFNTDATNVKDAIDDLYSIKDELEDVKKNYNQLNSEASFYKLKSDSSGFVYSGDYNGECTMTSFEFTKSGNYKITAVVGTTVSQTDTVYYYINNSKNTWSNVNSDKQTLTLTLKVNKGDLFRTSRTRASQNGWFYLYSLNVEQV